MAGGVRTSDKHDRSLANRKFRRKTKIKLNLDPEETESLPVSLKEVSDPWGFASDGKARWVGTEYDNQRK